jgi:hypothetical protein
LTNPAKIQADDDKIKIQVITAPKDQGEAGIQAYHLTFFCTMPGGFS